MAIAQMAKVMIVSHRSQASGLLEAIQNEGICQILNAEEAVVAADLSEKAPGPDKPKTIEAMLDRLRKSMEFAKNYVDAPKGLTAALAPRTVVDERHYAEVISDMGVAQMVDNCQSVEAAMEKTHAKIEELEARIDALKPWKTLETPVEEMCRFRKATCWMGLIPLQQSEQTAQRLTDLGAAIATVGSAGSKNACIIVSLNEAADDVAKVLRAAEFEPVCFEGMAGKVRDLIAESTEKLNRLKKRLVEHRNEAEKLSDDILKLEILHDHYQNLLNREQARNDAPATEHTVILEGWVKTKDYARLQEIVSCFDYCSLTKIEPAKDEEIPVEIENKRLIKPFEVITRLYGMPKHFEVDPTVFLAPFFALFFGLCLTDAGYGLIMVLLAFLLVRKMQGDKKLLWMLAICGAVTVVAGAATGGWFGNAHDYLPAWFGKFRNGVLWFDPFVDPMKFFALALVLGYVQIMTGLVIAFGHNLKRKDYVAAIFDQLTWLVMLNSVVLLLAAKAGAVPQSVAKICTVTAIIPAAGIFLLSSREGGWAGRLGMGLYNLFSAIFYMGDVLSYLRLMALGMVTAGLAMAINVIAQIAAQIPYGIGIVAAILVLVGGHGFNMAINALGAFVHTLRLQYVEFFPKFLVGGGRAFQPLTKQYKHVYIKKDV